MHIHFRKIRYKNFLATGNDWIEILLDKSATTLITGRNGSGKSTILEALTYALYGKAYRNINKPQLVNSMTKKNCEVQLEFRIGKKEYKVIRGMSPNIFEIYIDGALQKQDAAVKDQQKHFEQTVLKMPEKTFRQLVALGSANYQHFMQLPLGRRREILENILDINVFSTMNLLLKEKISSNKSTIYELDHQLTLLENKMELTRKHLEEMQADNDILIQRKKDKIDSISNDVDILLSKIQKNNEIAEEKGQLITDFDNLSSKLEKLKDHEKLANQKIDALHNELDFFTHNDSCPTCKQEIEETFKCDTIHKKESRVNEIEAIRQDILRKREALVSKIAEYQIINNEITLVNKEILQDNLSIRHLQQAIKDLEDEMVELTDKKNDLLNDQKDIKQIKRDMKSVEKKKQDAMSRQQMYEVSSTMLKDTGIKTRIVKQYIPIINKLINKYLATLEFFCDFELDETFSEKIKSRGRDNFTYASFSEGEKQRLDLSVVFTWRAIAKMRNSLSTNLLFMDETFDSSTDSMGVEAIMLILEEELKDSNVFVISHNEKLYDKFHSVITFEKERGFTKMVGIK